MVSFLSSKRRERKHRNVHGDAHTSVVHEIVVPKDLRGDELSVYTDVGGNSVVCTTLQAVVSHGDERVVQRGCFSSCSNGEVVHRTIEDRISHRQRRRQIQAERYT